VISLALFGLELRGFKFPFFASFFILRLLVTFFSYVFKNLI